MRDVHCSRLYRCTVTLQLYFDAAPCTTGQVQLAGGNIPNEGRVEICISTNVWSTVCDDSWSSVDATVVCQQLGYSTQGNNRIKHNYKIFASKVQ